MVQPIRPQDVSNIYRQQSAPAGRAGNGSGREGTGDALAGGGRLRRSDQVNLSEEARQLRQVVAVPTQHVRPAPRAGTGDNIGPAIAIGMLVGKAMEALGRNPEARTAIQTSDPPRPSAPTKPGAFLISKLPSLSVRPPMRPSALEWGAVCGAATDKPAGARLSFFTVEAFPLLPADMARSHAVRGKADRSGRPGVRSIRESAARRRVPAACAETSATCCSLRWVRYQ